MVTDGNAPPVVRSPAFLFRHPLRKAGTIHRFQIVGITQKIGFRHPGKDRRVRILQIARVGASSQDCFIIIPGIKMDYEEQLPLIVNGVLLQGLKTGIECLELEHGGTFRDSGVDRVT